MSPQSLIVGPPLYFLPDLLKADFPEHIITIYLTNTKPDPGELCLVEASGREFHGFIREYEQGVYFERPTFRIRARRHGFRILAVLRPVIIAQGAYETFL